MGRLPDDISLDAIVRERLISPHTGDKEIGHMSDASKEAKVERVKLGVDVRPKDYPPTKTEDQDLDDGSQADLDEYIGKVQREIVLAKRLLKEASETIRRSIIDFETKLSEGIPDPWQRKVLMLPLHAILLTEWSAVESRFNDEQARIFKHIEIAVFRDFSPQEFLNDWGIESRHYFGELADDIYDYLVTGDQRLDPDLTLENVLWFLEEKILERTTVSNPASASIAKFDETFFEGL